MHLHLSTRSKKGAFAPSHQAKPHAPSVSLVTGVRAGQMVSEARSSPNLPSSHNSKLYVHLNDFGYLIKYNIGRPHA